jgi:hypothetical protein
MPGFVTARTRWLLIVILGLSILGSAEKLAFGQAKSRSTDPRNIRNGLPIPRESYCDQPYVVVTKDGHWLCTLTTAPAQEGAKSQHIVSTISEDHGKTWSKPVAIEPSGVEASWVTPLVVPGGRVYVFYDYNGDHVNSLPEGAVVKDFPKFAKPPIRADMLGWYCYKFSDDGGRSWSNERFRIPMRVTACDRANQWQGKVQIFWGIDKPKIVGGDVLFAFT